MVVLSPAYAFEKSIDHQPFEASRMFRRQGVHGCAAEWTVGLEWNPDKLARIAFVLRSILECVVIPSLPAIGSDP